jgi:hypothetical protein
MVTSYQTNLEHNSCFSIRSTNKFNNKTGGNTNNTNNSRVELVGVTQKTKRCPGSDETNRGNTSTTHRSHHHQSLNTTAQQLSRRIVTTATPSPTSFVSY